MVLNLKIFFLISAIFSISKGGAHYISWRREYKTSTDLEDLYLPTLLVFWGMRGSGKTYVCVQMCLHFEQKGYMKRTFLSCPTAGDNEKDQKETIYANLKSLKADNVYTNNNQFEKQSFKSKREWNQNGKFMRSIWNTRSIRGFHKWKETGNDQL